MSTVKVKEWVSGPGQYVEKSYTFAELRETFSEGDLVWSLLDEVERLRTGSIHSCHDRCPRIECVQRREIERLKRIEELALIWSAYQFDSRRALHQQADDAAIALLDALDSDKVAARLDAAKRCADPTTGSRDV